MSAGNEREYIDHLQNKEGKEQAMKCPLANYTLIKYEGENALQKEDCLKEECACWDQLCNQCPILTIARSLDIIAEKLIAISNKMPHEAQFRK